MSVRCWLMRSLASVALVAAGCHNCGSRSCYQPCPPATISRSLGYGAVPAGAPCQSFPVMPPRAAAPPPARFASPLPPTSGTFVPPPGATLSPPPGAATLPPSAGVPQPPPGWTHSQFPPFTPAAPTAPPSSPPPAVWVPAHPPAAPPAAGIPQPPPPSSYQPAPPPVGSSVAPPPGAASPSPPPASIPGDSQGPSALPPDSVQNAYSSPPSPGVRLNPPEPATKDDRSRTEPPAPPREQSAEPPAAPRTDAPGAAPGGSPGAAAPSPAMPAGIPGFTSLAPGVSVGRRPFLDGLDWLKDHGYRTIVYLRRTGDASDDADRAEFETRRGLKYVALDVSPRDLTPDLVKRFSDLVRDTAGHPVFIYDRDGSLVGGLAYLYFRTVGGLPDAEALRRATAAGLRQEDNGPHREMLLAVQKYLGDAAK